MKIELKSKTVYNVNKDDLLTDYNIFPGQVYDVIDSSERFKRPYVVISSEKFEKYVPWMHSVKFCRITSADKNFWNIPIVLESTKHGGLAVSFVDTAEIVVFKNHIIDMNISSLRRKSISTKIVDLICRIFNRDMITSISEYQDLIYDVYQYSKMIESYGIPVYEKENMTTQHDNYTGMFDSTGRRIKYENKLYLFDHNFPEINGYEYVFHDDNSDYMDNVDSSKIESAIIQFDDLQESEYTEKSSTNQDIEEVNTDSQKIEDLLKKLRFGRNNIIKTVNDLKEFVSDYENLQYKEITEKYHYSIKSQSSIWNVYKKAKLAFCGNDKSTTFVKMKRPKKEDLECCGTKPVEPEIKDTTIEMNYDGTRWLTVEHPGFIYRFLYIFDTCSPKFVCEKFGFDNISQMIATVKKCRKIIDEKLLEYPKYDHASLEKIQNDENIVNLPLSIELKMKSM